MSAYQTGVFHVLLKIPKGQLSQLLIKNISARLVTGKSKKYDHPFLWLSEPLLEIGTAHIKILSDVKIKKNKIIGSFILQKMNVFE